MDLPLTDRGKLDVGGSLGIGQLTVIKDLGLKEPYMGQIDLVSGKSQTTLRPTTIYQSSRTLLSLWESR